MARQIFLLILLMTACTGPCSAQQGNFDHNDQRGWEMLFSNLVTEEDETQDWDVVYDALCELESSPVDINTATKEDLQRIPFLNDEDIAEILEYVFRNGDMLSKQELVSVKSLSAVKRTLLEYFIKVVPTKHDGFPSVKNLLRYGDNKLVADGNVPLYSRKGDKNGYMGYKYKHSLRYDHTYGDYLRIGFVAAQDAGEPFFSGRNRMGYDFYSGYLSLRKLGRIKQLTVGRYRLGMGMGLIMNNNLSFGKTLLTTTVNRSGTTIRPHSSRSSYNYLQGVAATVGICRNVDISAFVSDRKIDATLNSDDGSIATILKSNYHRTESEMNKKNNASQFAAGGNITYAPGRFVFGISAIYTSLSRMLQPNTSSAYRRYYASGKEFCNIGIDYGYHNGKFSFLGETATGNCKAVATINSVSYRLLSNLSLNAVQRYYSYRYYSLFSSSFSDGGAVQNESGLYVGASWQPLRKLSVRYYFDVAYFPWAKYQAAEASHSFDNMLSAEYNTGNVTIAARYRLKIREKDNADKSGLIDQTTHRARLSAKFTAEAWNVKAQCDISSMKYKDNSFGYMASVSGGCTAIRNIGLYASTGYFNTDDYNSRIYAYERGMAYDFSFPSYYGEGIRYSLFLNAEVIKNLKLSAKFGVTNLFDRNTIGSGLQQVDKSSVADVQLQLGWKF